MSETTRDRAIVTIERQ